jgi:regulator of replication initiation timing
MQTYTNDEIINIIESTLIERSKKIEQLQKLCNELADHGREMADDQLRAENARLRSHLAHRVVELNSDEEVCRYRAFLQKHNHEDIKRNQKQFSDRMPYIIQHNYGIGIGSAVYCPICGEEEDITDTEAW